MSSDVKILFVGDMHLTDTPPVCRKDDYSSAVLGKLRQAIGIAQSEGVAAIVLLGDVFHRKRPLATSHSLVSRVLEVLLEAKRAGIPVLAVAGNHDQYQSPNLAKQPLAVLATAGAVTLLDGSPYPLVKEAGGCQVEINGLPYDESLDASALGYAIPVSSPEAVKVWCYHAMLLPDGRSFFGDFVNFRDVAQVVANKARVVACGHYHPGFQAVEEHGVVWINPGALGRNSADDYNYTASPQVALLRVASEEVIEVQHIALDFATAAEVLAAPVLAKEDTKRSASIEEFVDTLASSVGEVDLTSPEAVKSEVYRICPDAEVSDLVIQLISSAREEA